MVVSRKAFVAAGAAALASVAFLRRPAGAAEFTLRYASAQQADNPVILAMNGVAEKVAAESNGRVQISLFPNSILGGDSSMLAQLRSGAIDFLTYLDGNLAAIAPLSAISNVGFAFKSYADVFAALDGPLGALVRADIERAGVHVFDRIWDNGFRQITTSRKPIASLADLAGLKIRVPPSRIEVSLFETLGASPTSLNFSEVYTALQTHVIEGQENPLTIIENGKVYEVQKYLSLTSHVWTGFWFLANAAKWAALPKDVTDLIARTIDAAALGQRKQSESLNVTLLAKLTAQGLVVNTPDTAPFKEKLKAGGFYKDWSAKFGPKAWDMLQKTTGSLG